MADYIKRSDLIQKAEHEAESMSEPYKSTFPSLVDWLSAKIVPIDDVAPVVHGEWIKARGSWCTPGGDPVWECSECGKGMHVYGIEHSTYGSDVADGQWVACPNCGARMDGAE